MIKKILILCLIISTSVFAHEEENPDQTDAAFFMKSLHEAHYYSIHQLIDIDSGYISLDNVLANFNAYSAALYLRKRNQHLKDEFFEHLEIQQEKTSISELAKELEANKAVAPALAKLLGLWQQFCEKIATNQLSVSDMENQLVAFANSAESKDASFDSLIQMRLFVFISGGNFQFNHRDQIKTLYSRIQKLSKTAAYQEIAPALKLLEEQSYAAKMLQDYYQIYSEKLFEDFEQKEWQRFLQLKSDYLLLGQKSFREIFTLTATALSEFKAQNPDQAGTIKILSDKEVEENILKWEQMPAESAAIAKSSLLLPSVTPMMRSRVETSSEYQALKKYSERYRPVADIMTLMSIESQL
jgi:hypothetical protein